MKQEFENPLLKRREVKHAISKNTNPGFVESAKHVAEHFKVTEDLVVVKAVRSGFGKNEFVIEAYIYKDADAKKHVEPVPKKKEAKS